MLSNQLLRYKYFRPITLNCPFWAAREYPSLLPSSFIVFFYKARYGVEGAGIPSNDYCEDPGT